MPVAWIPCKIGDEKNLIEGGRGLIAPHTAHIAITQPSIVETACIAGIHASSCNDYVNYSA